MNALTWNHPSALELTQAQDAGADGLDIYFIEVWKLEGFIEGLDEAIDLGLGSRGEFLKDVECKEVGDAVDELLP